MVNPAVLAWKQAWAATSLPASHGRTLSALRQRYGTPAKEKQPKSLGSFTGLGKTIGHRQRAMPHNRPRPRLEQFSPSRNRRRSRPAIIRNMGKLTRCGATKTHKAAPRSMSPGLTSRTAKPFCRSVTVNMVQTVRNGPGKLCLNPAPCMACPSWQQCRMLLYYWWRAKRQRMLHKITFRIMPRLPGAVEPRP